MSQVIHSRTCQFATFQLADLWLGINIRCIREINRVTEMTPVPDAPECVRGVINLRGDVVTVMDLRTILQLPAGELTPKSRWMIVESGDEQVGLLVDHVSDVVQVDMAEIEPLPANLARREGQFFTGVYRWNNELLVVLDVEAALAAADAPNLVPQV